MLGLVIIRPVNAFLSWVFRGFNWWFDRVTEVYGRAVGRLLRVSAIVLLAYVGLLVLTGWTMAVAPTGFIPTQDQGYLLVNAQLPDSWSVQETQKVDGEDPADGDGRPDRPQALSRRQRRRPRAGRLGPIVPAERQRLELRLGLRHPQAV